MTRNLEIRVAGNVQGVNFRNETQKFARENAVAGYVRNEPDGTVFLEAEGEQESLDRFVDWLKAGPPAADVDDIGTSEGDVKFYKDFKVDHEGEEQTKHSL